MASSLTSPKLIFASNKAIIAARGELAKVSLFSTNFSDEAAQPGETLKVPIFLAGAAKDFDQDSSNYEDANGSCTWVPIDFKIHKHSTFQFNDKDFLDTSLTLWDNAGVAAGQAIGEALVGTIVGGINKTTVPTSGLDPNYTQEGSTGKTAGGVKIPTFSAANECVFKAESGKTLKKAVALLRGQCKKVGIKPSRSTLALHSDLFAELLDLLDSNIYGGTQSIQDGIIPRLFGFKAIMECDEWTDDNLKGAVIQEDSLAIASRVVPVGTPSQYAEIGTTTDENTGLVLGVRRHGNPGKGANFATVECLFGYKLLQPTKVIRLVDTATANTATEDTETASS